MFMVGDPLIDEHEFYTMKEMDVYAGKVKKGEMMVPSEMLTSSVEARFVTEAIFYRLQTDVGKQVEELETAPPRVNPTVEILEIADSVKDNRGQEYLNVKVDGEAVGKRKGVQAPGWVLADYIIQ